METKGLKQIGKGAFSTVYKKGTNKVLIKSCDNVKECMSMGWFPNTKMFPKIEKVGVSDCGEFQFYEEKFYERKVAPKKDLSPNEYEFYQALRNLDCYCKKDCDRYYHWHNQFDSLPAKFNHKKKLLKEALNALSNYGTDISFEISPRNIAIQAGKLVLLDCFFFVSALNRIRDKKKY